MYLLYYLKLLFIIIIYRERATGLREFGLAREFVRIWCGR